MLAPDGSFKQLGFYSAHLSETQKKYSVFKKELLGAFKSLRHFPAVISQNDTTLVELTFQETQKTDLQPKKGSFILKIKYERCGFVLGTFQ